MTALRPGRRFRRRGEASNMNVNCGVRVLRRSSQQIARRREKCSNGPLHFGHSRRIVGKCSTAWLYHEPMTSDFPVDNMDPMGGDELMQALGSIPVGERLEEAFSCYLLGGVSLGFAMATVPRLLKGAKNTTNGPLSASLKHVAESLTQKAVLSAAATYDEAGAGANSLANTLTMITQYVRQSMSISSGDRRAAQKLINEIRESVITHKTKEVRAIRAWRNMWAGHNTSDVLVDPWAEDNPVDLEVIRVGLDQMRAAFLEFALLLDQLPELASLVGDARRIDDHTSRAGISLEGTTSMPLEFFLSMGRAQGEELLNHGFPFLKD